MTIACGKCGALVTNPVFAIAKAEWRSRYRSSNQPADKQPLVHIQTTVAHKVRANDRKYETCPICSVSILAGRLQKHLGRAHGEPASVGHKQPTKVSPKQITCPVCNKWFPAPEFATHVKARHPKSVNALRVFEPWIKRFL